MPTEQLLLRLPEELVQRFRRTIPSRERSLFVQHLLEQALSDEAQGDDPLYLVGLAVEQDERLAAEMADWQETMADDGLADLPPFKPAN